MPSKPRISRSKSASKGSRSNAGLQSTPTLKIKLSSPAITASISKKGSSKKSKEKKKSKFKEEDSDDETSYPTEEHLILRLPNNPQITTKFKDAVQKREIPEGFKIAFKDSRNATAHIYNEQYSAKLVDLPCITESLKTFDNKQYYKIADICQMLVVSPNPTSSQQPAYFQQSQTSSRLNSEEYVFPDGLTPPLRNVRKRRFRKRMVNHRAIENIEAEVERLLSIDSNAEEVRYEIIEEREPSSSDGEDEESSHIPSRSQMDEDTQSMASVISSQVKHEQDADEEEDSDLDLAAEIEKGIAVADEEDESDEEDEDEDEDEEDEEDEEEGEGSSEGEGDDIATLQNDKSSLLEEISDLETKLNEKIEQIEKVPNPILKKRFQDQQTQIEEKLLFKRSQVMEIDTRLRELGE